MRCILFLVVPLTLLCFESQGQVKGPQFVAVSIKPVAPSNPAGALPVMRGGPGTREPGLFTCSNCNVVGLVHFAYGPLSFGQFQSSSALNSLIAAPFDIFAKLPPGATVEEFRIMLRDLLAERFKVATHRELRILPAFELSVTKDGPKFKQAEPNNDEPPTLGVFARPERASDGSLIVPSGATLVAAKGQATIKLLGKPISSLVQILSTELRTPVLDKTGLMGIYDVSVSWQWEGQDRADRQAGLQEAIRSKLGLQLRLSKGEVPVLVLDHAEKPTEN